MEMIYLEHTHDAKLIYNLFYIFYLNKKNMAFP